MAPAPASMTISHFLGEMTWLLSQSPLHRELAIKDLDWLVMPPLALEQFYLFRDGGKPVGLALWAKCDAAAAAKLQAPRKAGAPILTLEEWNSGDQVWLVDLVCPFANEANRQRELMVADLIVKPLAGVDLHMPYSSDDGTLHVRVIDAAVGVRLTHALAEAAGGAR